MNRLEISPTVSLPIDAVTGTFGILATKGAGKSNAAVKMAEEMHAAGVPWVAIDPKGDWWGVRSSADGKGPGLPVVVFGGRHGDVPLEPTAGVLLAELVHEHALTCVLDVSEFTKGETIRFLHAFGERLFRLAHDEPMHLFLEEAHEYLPQRVESTQAQMVAVWQRIVKQGRFKGLGCTLISQRSASLNKDVLELVDTLIVLRTIGPRSREAIKAWIADQDVDAGLTASLPTLDDGEAWLWSPGALKLMERIRFHRRTTFDSGATPKVGERRRAPSTLADVDLGAITTAMAATIEKVKADDPAHLRKELTAATKRIEQLTEHAAHLTEHAAQLERNPIRGYDVVPQEIIESLQRYRTQLTAIADDTTELIACAVLVNDQTAEPAAPTIARPASKPVITRPAPKPAPTPRPHVPDMADGDLPVGERRVLVAAAQHDAGVTREQLAILAGYKKSTRDLYIRKLVARGYLEQQGARLHATPAGVDALGSGFEPLPTGAALRDHWLRELPEGERRILGLLVDEYPSSIDRETLSDACGYKKSTRDLYLRKLTARHLVVHDSGAPSAAPFLFDVEED